MDIIFASAKESFSGQICMLKTRNEFDETMNLIFVGMIETSRYVTDVMKQLQHASEGDTSKRDL